MRTLSGHSSFDTAHIDADYPYGFRLRTQRAVWLEFKKGHGFRMVTATINPKTGRWNKPKTGIYVPLGVLVMDDAGHIQLIALSFGATQDEVGTFSADYADAYTGDHINAAQALLHYHFAAKRVRFTVGGDGPRQTPEEAHAVTHAAYVLGYADMKAAEIG